MNKQELAEDGEKMAYKMCALNDLEFPKFTIVACDDRIVKLKAMGTATCGFYRRRSYFCASPEIVVSWSHCAHIGSSGMAWSYPGYVIDRTPYGVIQHELGHYWFDLQRMNGKDAVGEMVAVSSSEEPITGYHPNPEEKCVEMFRLYVTNPNLLAQIRPNAYAWLRERIATVETRNWKEILSNAPERTIQQAEKKIAQQLKK